MNRRTVLVGLAVGLTGAVAAQRIEAAAPVSIRYTTGGGIAPNEIETAIWTPYVQQNVLKNYGKAYTVEMIFTKGTSEGAEILAAGQADVGILAPPSLANVVAKDAVPGGVTVISDLLQEGDVNYASNTYMVLADSSINQLQ